MGKFDQWLGKTLFIPIAIRVCQQFKITQYALHTYIWLVVWLTWVWDGPAGSPPGIGSWIFYAIVCIFALLWTVLTALRPGFVHQPAASWIRMMWVLLFTQWLVVMVVGVYVGEPVATPAYHLVRDWCILLAEYALLIKTIPPLESKEEKRAAKLARQEA